MIFTTNRGHIHQPQHLHPKRDRLLMLVGCLLPILRRTFTDDEIDFMIAFRASMGKRHNTA
ncbi:MAG: DUF2059 domain-containing protein [Planctomycetota bacterium]